MSKRTIFDSRDYYKPFDYPYFFSAWSKQQSMFWLPFEVNLKVDKYEFENKLSEDERKILLNVFSIFTHTDFCVSRGYMKLLGAFNMYEIQACIAAFINMETIHAESYSHMIERLGLSSDLHQKYKEVKVLLEKDDIMQWGGDINNDLDLLKTIARISVFTEGFILFSLFGVTLSMPRQGLLKGIGQINTFAMRDETLHHKTMLHLFFLAKEQMLELGRITQEDVDKMVKDLNMELEHLLKVEFETIDFLFDHDRLKIRGTNSEEIKQYVIKLAGRAEKIGLSLPNYIVEDPETYPGWIDELVNLRENVDFFTQRPTEYKKADVSDLDDDDFK